MDGGRAPEATAPDPATPTHGLGGVVGPQARPRYRGSARKAREDIVEAIQRWQLLVSLAVNDIARRYRGSLLGPFWVTITLGVKIGTLAAIYPSLTGASLASYVPFLTLGFVLWLFIAGVFSDASMAFISAAPYTRQIRLPFTLIVLQTVLRNFIILGHHAIIYLIVLACFPSVLLPGPYYAWLIPAFLLLAWIAMCLTYILGMLGARYRDIPEAINSIVQIFFFVTPIFWQPTDSAAHRLLLLLNPFYHAIEIARAPLLGQPPPATSWGIMLAMAAVLTVTAWWSFVRFRHRINFWN